jgi:hypothetical protein
VGSVGRRASDSGALRARRSGVRSVQRAVRMGVASK